MRRKSTCNELGLSITRDKQTINFNYRHYLPAKIVISLLSSLDSNKSPGGSCEIPKGLHLAAIPSFVCIHR